MARRLILWGGIGGLAVGLVVLGFGAIATHRSRFQGPGHPYEDSQLEVRRRKSEAALGAATTRLAVARHRLQIARLLDASTDSTSLAIEVDAGEWRDSALQASLAGAIRRAWSDLGLDLTKVAVGVVVVDRATVREWARGLSIPPGEPVGFYALPDSLAPATCVAMVVAPPERVRDPAQLRAMATSWFGPCAFYARFGIPAPRVRRWLDARGLDVARIPDWSQEGEERPRLAQLDPNGPGADWYWGTLSMMPPHSAGCLAGRTPSCRIAVTNGDDGSGVGRATLVPQLDQQWRLDRQQLAGGERYLGAVVREVGARRFQEFWRTALPVDSALTLALGHPVGEWTAKWERSVAPAPRFGPGPRWYEGVWACLLASGALLVVGKNVRRREVR